jgi:hypothetical protein
VDKKPFDRNDDEEALWQLLKESLDHRIVIST